ncbi:hypothetical protein ACH414_00610 [Streptomyces sp. NPDC020422]|uniref:hypothetical protein n=1 Tax=Streptomyces sp. NPDC020422 TaxID=3365074 RepID=UPI00379CF798
MSIVVTFAGRTPLPTAGSWYPIWSSRVQSSSPADLRPGQRLALALPADVDLRDPALFPGVPAPDGAFAEAAPAPGAGTRAGRSPGPDRRPSPSSHRRPKRTGTSSSSSATRAPGGPGR